MKVQPCCSRYGLQIEEGIMQTIYGIDGSERSVTEADALDLINSGMWFLEPPMLPRTCVSHGEAVGTAFIVIGEENGA